MKPVIVLQFSGGKDSLACLLLLKERLDDIIVVWADSGDTFPETRAQMEAVKAMCPNFVVAQGNQPRVIEEFGYPVDVLPCRNHAQTQYLTQQERPKLQGFLDCCIRSMLAPMAEKTKELGATVIIRGQRLADKQKSPVRSGDVIDGVTYWFPIEDWTDEEVMEYVKDSPLLPHHYSEARTSLDCMHCTAHLADNQWKVPYLLKHHKKEGKEVLKRLNIIKTEIDRDLSLLKQILTDSERYDE
jgi:3'-phosphoadenosine 5'-phosphosulfate sulfotransferase (PAPS reductase)/FAD synthetase